MDCNSSTDAESGASTAAAQTDALTRSAQRVVDNIMGRLSEAVDAAVDASVDKVEWLCEGTTGAATAMPVSSAARTQPSADQYSDVVETRRSNSPRDAVADGVRDVESASTSQSAGDGPLQPVSTAESVGDAEPKTSATLAGRTDEEKLPPSKRAKREKATDGSSMHR
eukprot:COSAG02_NODE_2144_length_9681_cov_209.373304_3_plen_168_part_00